MMMVTAKQVGVALDVRTLSAELGATVKQGKVSIRDGKYCVTVGALSRQIVVGDTTPESDGKTMVDTPIAVVMADRTIVAVRRLARRSWVVCHVPGAESVQDDPR